MNDRVKKLGDEALKLDLRDRVELVDLILASVQSSPDETHQSWTDEVLDRVRAYERGDFDITDADDVLAHARANLRR
jgi:hypothetical protein